MTADGIRQAYRRLASRSTRARIESGRNGRTVKSLLDHARSLACRARVD
jgi:hypothetical protein